jgi:opacity protein-like surface antigen
MKRFSAGLLCASTSALVACPANAGIDLGISGGFVKRSLSQTDYKTGFAWQLNGDISFFPLLMVGPYVTFANSTPEIGSDATSIAFRTVGARVKLKLPLSDTIQPYGVAGAGWAHGDFPDQTLQICPTSGNCVTRVVPSATANFAEFLVGGGLLWTPVAPLAFSAEFNWRPTTGYQNDTYETRIQSGETSAPSPSRNGVAWVGLLGIGLSL